MPKNGSMAANVRVIIMILLEKIVSNKLYISDILTNEKVDIFYCFKQDNFFELMEFMEFIIQLRIRLLLFLIVVITNKRGSN